MKISHIAGMNIVVTGASSGIGYQIAKRFLSSSDHQVLALANDRSGLERLCDEVTHRDHLTIHEVDLEWLDDEALDMIGDFFPLVDILINNAGVVINKPFANTPEKDWHKIFAINFFAPVRLIRGLLSKLKLAKNPHIINIGSVGGFQGSVKFPGLTAYSASKAALANLTESLAEEFSSEGISINCLCPGSVDTDMFRTAFPGQSAGASSEEMARFICQFALQAPGIVNGKVLPISNSIP